MNKLILADPNNEPWGTLITTFLWHHSSSVPGPCHPGSFYPVKGVLVQSMSCQLLQEYAVGDSIKGFTEIE